MIEITETLKKPRAEIQRHLLMGNVQKVLEMAGMLHGHYCPGLALGVKAVHAGFGKLGIENNTGMEEVMAVAECNSCFVDGVQFAAGCSLGNNSLVYQDLGKTAVTFYRRGASDAVRVYVKSFDLPYGTEQEKKEGDALFEKAVKRREKLSDEESKRMKEIWITRSFAVAEAPAETLFTITRLPAPSIAFAPIYDSQECAQCSEKIMETKAVFRNGRPMCIPCAKEEFRMVVGKGIATGRGLNP